MTTSLSLKEKLNKRQVTIGSWITIGNEIIAEIMAKMNFDWLLIDMEHSAMDLTVAQNLVRVIEQNGTSPLIRVGENNANLIKRAMDTGAHGVMVPMVNSAEEARRAVAAVKYPPKGTRGVGLARAQGYGTGFEHYKNWVNKESVVVIQIEHIDAVENFEEIMAVEGIDAFVIGPYDLSGSVGYPGKFNHPKVKNSLKSVLQISEKKKYNAGIHVIPPDYKEVNKQVKSGFKFVALSLDTLLLAKFTEDSLKKIKRSA
ncbi:MAG: 2,4-dihydroxyhept-2-ene-1,7-dioic acid aldolase [Candidatus Omnitrophica bacterium]|nr:2,4-dihydroxyhept-2-ene-1,7-dioic acid aldolase [Candidatus Omnitrophota bacterium]MCA9405507.1 2,4-dihydroxyhept-2-ene-1,7-dioic acid aldolase [Candidatus Omnitrophota bacterium]